MSDTFDHAIDALERQEADPGEPLFNTQEERDSRFTDIERAKRKPTLPSLKPRVGPGKCPKCGAETRYKESPKVGPFYGCTRFPQCTGSREATSKETAIWRDNKAFYAEKAEAALKRVADQREKSLQFEVLELLRKHAKTKSLKADRYFVRTLIAALEEYYKLVDTDVDQWYAYLVQHQ